MAQPAFLNDQSLLSENPELMDLARKRKMAELLMSQEQPAGQMVSGRYVKPSFTQQLAPLVGIAVGENMNKQLDEQQQKYVDALRKLGSKETLDILESAQGRPESQQELAGPAYQGVAPSIQYPAMEANPQAALAKALVAQSPQGKALAAPLMQNLLPKKTDKLIEYDTYKKEGGKLPFSEWVNRVTPEQEARLAIDRQRLGLEGARLNLEQAKVAQELQFGKPLTESQGKAAVFHSQMVSASNELNNIYNKGFNPNKPNAQVQTSLAGGVFNALMPSNSQEAKQSQNQWTEAYLRFKTGAGTNASEVESNRKTYFPQIGDKPDLIAQKARMRAQAEQDISMASGPQGSRMGAQSNVVAPAINNQSKPVQVKQQFDPTLLQFMTPEQQALFK